MVHVRRLCEQKYHGVVRCALGWACWNVRGPAGDGLMFGGFRDECMLGKRFIRCKATMRTPCPVQEAELSVMRRIGSIRSTPFSSRRAAWAGTYGSC